MPGELEAMGLHAGASWSNHNGELPSNERRLLEEQASNRRLAASLRAKTQLLELADDARSRMKSESASCEKEHTEKLEALEKALEHERQSVGTLTAALQRAHTEIEQQRTSQREQAATIEAQRSEFENQHGVLSRQLSMLRQSEETGAELVSSIRRTMLKHEVEGRKDVEGGQPLASQIGAPLELMERLAAVLSGGDVPTEQTSPREGGIEMDAITSQLASLVERCEGRITQADVAAAAARDRAACAEFALQAAPTTAALCAQAEQAGEVR